MKLKPNPRNAFGKEEITEKITIPEQGNLQRILSKKPTTDHSKQICAFINFNIKEAAPTNLTNTTLPVSRLR
ncbi:hypothetical protein L9X51_19210 [Vibrio aestuarianus]|uniref:Uncharacterized protein n=1 Tax=Vibrio aestuarianus TaxID=28171 RepID=A0A9X4FHC7_9VIBR|nr:hypothetical protein [Vibrio aestuarianus]MDE1348487.1 hypothetical protein [Vibrio aestuarianus]NGZ18905.1 hypothetical protein [Vibrio aestuarianus]NGZ68871.1 hypothetical protein [Vibrio aestuarianus subsp. cardii]